MLSAFFYHFHVHREVSLVLCMCTSNTRVWQTTAASCRPGKQGRTLWLWPGGPCHQPYPGCLGFWTHVLTKVPSNPGNSSLFGHLPSRVPNKEDAGISLILTGDLWRSNDKMIMILQSTKQNAKCHIIAYATLKQNKEFFIPSPCDLLGPVTSFLHADIYFWLQN